ncbi:hypothetical protein [Flavobacterium hibernum]|uniref:Uncharacterized protein n=1 Tax=Flavobacterium hibernum TaxID=37752 RepID=A0A0D0EZ63_9FLAO|nr:hypothetical protein [Flavobacterium hibernum]KIO54353.1 hypothetical protein IW18_02540 [Flavobacterium hibernum]OXA88182.1 hypothetical protein B0A73_10455 [Flavobacterium hibernum]STO10808.1 Uncharacterised protein [Flavobacterium hibernum]
MTQTYLLEWMDLTVTSTLNPNKTDLTLISPIQSREIIEKANEQTFFIQSQFTIQVFSLTKEKQIKILVGNYYSTLLFLLDKITEINNSNDLHRDSLIEVTTTLMSCLNELIIFIESRFANYLTAPFQIVERKTTSPIVMNGFSGKVLCKLSTDQTALILRASDELKILISKSMNHLFKTIVPFLSTPNKADLSYNAMRSKAYVFEERDKQIAIETLERMIKQIKEY